MAGALKSDHVNYLVWRYLQERGYGRAAVQLTRDWGAEPQQLPFANGVKPYTLISILQDGLAYDALQAHAHARDSPRASQATSQHRSPSDPTGGGKRYGFIEERKRRVSEHLDETRNEGPRKRQKVQVNGNGKGAHQGAAGEHGPSRPSRRKSVAANVIAQEDRMVIDEPQHAAPEPKAKSKTPVVEEVEMAYEAPKPLISTLEVGVSVGVQSDKPYEISRASTIADLVVPGSDVLHVHWSMSDPSSLLCTGGSICRSWTIPPVALQKTNSHALNFSDHASGAGKFFVGIASTAPSDKVIAYSMESRQGSELLVMESPTSQHSEKQTRSPIRRLSYGVDTVLVLSWNPTSNLLLVSSLHGTRARICIYDVERNIMLRESVIARPAIGATWAGDSHILLCGEGFLELHSASPTIAYLSSLESAEVWPFLKYDAITERAACASAEDGVVALIDIGAESLLVTARKVQDGCITALDWQPIHGALSENTPRLLATSSTDGTVSIWDARGTLVLLHTLLMSAGAPAMALAFSPDGTLVAAAGEGRMNVWRAEAEGKAVWRWDGVERESNGQIQEETVVKVKEVEDKDGIGTFDSLAWNAQGKALAYGQGERVWVVGV